jgi:hypothetical protein
LVFFSVQSFAGNPDRAGAAGAGQLLVNPWGRTSGLSGSAMASVNGIEATFLNVAGLAFTRKTELMFTNSNYLVGSNIKMNAFGFAQKIGNAGAIGVTVANMNFGENMITKESLPEGGIGNFTPSYTNIGISYAKGFSNSIYGGVTVRLISEAIYNVKAQGASFDAGIRYVTGERDHIRFGITLKNVGPPMRYRGEGLTFLGLAPSSNYQMTVEQRSATLELPSLVNVGLAYDFLFGEKMKLTANGQYTSNSFTRDQAALGAEFSYNNKFFVRGGYAKEMGKQTSITSRSAFTGVSGGMTIQGTIGKGETIVGLDYSYRATNPFGGVHSIGVHIAL